MLGRPFFSFSPSGPRAKDHEPSAGKMVSFTVGDWNSYSGCMLNNAGGLAWYFGAYIDFSISFALE